ncbi:MAG: HpcH/HpaI aldolase family protein [Candidatus Dormibacteria bacterium]
MSIERSDFIDVVASRQVVIGAVIMFADPAIAEITCASWDFVMVDMEHGAIGLHDLHRSLIAARASGTPALVRIPSEKSELLAPVLDAGAVGVVVSHVESSAQATDLVSRLRYPPLGSRGWGPRRAAVVGGRPGINTVSDRVLCIAQIETQLGVEAAGAVAAVDGIDALLVGASDLSVELGVPVQYGSELVRDAIRSVQAACREAGVVSGVAGVRPPELLVEVCGRDSTILLAGSDMAAYDRSNREAAHSVRALVSLNRGTATH